MEKIELTASMSGKEKEEAVRRALVAGFYHEAARFPVYSAKEQPFVSAQAPQEAGGQEPPADWKAASDYPRELPETDLRAVKGLEKLFAKGRLLPDRNEDGLPDALAFRILLQADCSVHATAAACNLAFRFGMETTAFAGSLVTCLASGEAVPADCHTVLVTEDEKTGVFYEEKDGFIHVTVSGRGEELESFTADLCSHFPLQPEGRTWSDVLTEIADGLSGRNADGELAAAVEAAADGAGVDAYVSPVLAARKDELKSHFPAVSFYNRKAKRQVYEKTYDIPWEKDVFLDVLKEKALPLMGPADEIRIEGALSEDRKVRSGLEEEIKEILAGRGISLAGCHVYCAYKQGYSWIEETVIPALKEKKAAKVEVAFRPFLPEGETKWKDEDGARPSYHNIGAGDPDAWYDLPIRFLQELYPAEDTLRRELGMEAGDVTFTTCEGEGSETYVCRGLDADGNEICTDTYRAAWGERPYLDEFPEMGKVHPATGYLRVWKNGELVLDERIRTDMEEVWDLFQADVIPDCRDYIEKKYPDGITADMQPFFAELRLEVNASEPDEKLLSREDMISSLDGLHEDMYFVGTDYFKNYGLQKSDELYDAPGLILPVLKKTEGKPYFKVTLSEPYGNASYLTCEGETRPVAAKQSTAYMTGIACEGGRTCVTVKTDASLARTKVLASLMEEGLTWCGNRISGADVIRFETPEGSCEAKIRPYEAPAKDRSITDIDLMEHQLIGYDDFMRIAGELRHVPGIDVYRTAVSYEGREVLAVEILPKDEGYVSRVKRITNHPSEYINARHHANEVSSTNAALILLKKILTEETYRDLPDKLNLIFIPMENVDGAALHYELQKDNPYWKFHVARFNAIGKEFYRDYFTPGTIHTEAEAFLKVWMRLLPDIVVDNHGVPSHEWEQQFSGYTSPSYKGFWLPRSLLYGYYWYIRDPEYSGNVAVNKKMEDVIADAIGEEPEMTALNKEWTAQFEMFAHKWLPRMFPADYYKGMIDYWIPFAYQADHGYTSIRYPWITTVAYTSEVADETAQGEYLNLCARAHVKHDEATLAMLMGAEFVYEDSFKARGEELFAAHIRRRPMIV